MRDRGGRPLPLTHDTRCLAGGGGGGGGGGGQWGQWGGWVSVGLGAGGGGGRWSPSLKGGAL
jgi:hypothetical protein